MLLTEKCGNLAVDLSAYDDIDWPDLQIQLELFRRKRSIKCMSDAVDILKGMSPELRGEYSEVEKLHGPLASRLLRSLKLNADVRFVLLNIKGLGPN
jgi:hypothetical protein